MNIKRDTMFIKRLCVILCIIAGFLSCTEDLDDSLLITEGDLISANSELFTLINGIVADDDTNTLEEVTCIDFIYPFTVVIYNETVQFVSREIVGSDLAFRDLLDTIEEGQFIGMSFPITSLLDDGTTFAVNDKDELREAIDQCLTVLEEEVVIQNGNGIITDCVWEIQLPEDVLFSTYTDAVFDVAVDGTITFYHRGIPYFGTWIFFFIEDELHLNINLDDQEQIGVDWNFDWRIPFIDEDTIHIETEEGLQFILEKECEAGAFCRALYFENCELDDNPEFAEFVLEEYDECVVIIAAPQQMVDPDTGEISDPIDWILTYYGTEEAAMMGINPLDATAPLLSVSRTIYVRIEDPITGAFQIAEIVLSVVACE